MSNAEKDIINIKETQIRPMNLCCLVPVFVKKIYIPTGTADNAKKGNNESICLATQHVVRRW